MVQKKKKKREKQKKKKKQENSKNNIVRFDLSHLTLIYVSMFFFAHDVLNFSWVKLVRQFRHKEQRTKIKIAIMEDAQKKIDNEWMNICD